MSRGVDTDRVAVRAAFQLRQELGIDIDRPIGAIDAAERRGVEVWFLNVGSMEGFYIREGSGRILLPADRPTGRQNFACAHELGHHEMGHGTKLTEYLEQYQQRDAAEERLADIFAASLLMPRAAVVRGFQKRGWNPSDPSPLQVYSVAAQLGVSYEGLLIQMSSVLRLIPERQSTRLRNMPPKEIRAEIVGGETTQVVVPVDEHWESTAIDLQIGDMAVFPRGVDITGVAVSVEVGGASVRVTAVSSGIAQAVSGNGWAQFIRVRRTKYAGYSLNRHMEDPDEH